MSAYKKLNKKPTTIDLAYNSARKLFKFGMQYDTVVDRLCSKYAGKLYYSDCSIIAQAVRQERHSSKSSRPAVTPATAFGQQEIAHV